MDVDEKGRIKCLRCPRWFKSVDRRRNRICPHCHSKHVYDPEVYRVPGTERKTKGREL